MVMRLMHSLLLFVFSVTTPEKWDVVTRKKKTINSWFRKVKLFW